MRSVVGKALVVVLVIGLSGCMNVPNGDVREAESEPEVQASPSSCGSQKSTPEIETEFFDSHAVLAVHDCWTFATGTVSSSSGFHWSSGWVNATNELVIPFLEPKSEYTAKVDLEHSSGSNQTVDLDFTTKDSTRFFASPDSALIYPGMGIVLGSENDPYSCSLGAIGRDGTNSTFYGISAGHCFVDFIGGPVWIRDESGLTRIGTVLDALYERRQDDDSNGFDYMASDWGLFLIDDELIESVSPIVPDMGGPTRLGEGVVQSQETVCFRGQIHPLDPAEGNFDGGVSCGQALGYREQNGWLEVRSTAFSGDSGSLVLHSQTGEPLGFLAAVNHATVDVQPACQAVSEIGARGHPLKLFSVDSFSALEESTSTSSAEATGSWVVQPWCPDDVRLLHAP